MKTKSVFVFCVLVVTLFSSLPTLAQPPGRGERGQRGGRGRQGMMARLEQLNVNDAQRTQIRGILREGRPTMHPLMKQYMAERRALREAIHTTPVNEAAIRTQSARVAQIKTEVDVRRAHMSQRIRAVLTAEQVQRLKEIERKFDQRMNAAVDRIGEKDLDE